MRLPGESEYSNSGLSIKYMMTGVCLCLLLILGVVVWTNKEAEAKRHKASREAKETSVIALEHGDGMESGADGTAEAPQEMSSTGAVMGFNGSKSMEEVERLYAEGRLVASDLDFWDMYPRTTQVYADSGFMPGGGSEGSSGNRTEDGQGSGAVPNDRQARYAEEAERESKEEVEKEQLDPAKDGKHTRVTLADGEEEWVLINPHLERNTYDFTKLTMRQEQLAYYADGKTYSYVGADLSKYNGEVDFVALKQSGVSYVMLRLGARGYGSGQIMLDEKFADYMVKATEAGLNIGVYFYSQAITEAEAEEEANFVIQNLENYQITYPVAFDMEYVPNDTARIESLNRDEKTKVAKAFLETVKKAGYKPLVYGTKEWLIKQVDLTRMTDYDIWLSQQEAVPDYPYQFQMWQYAQDGNLSGVDGDVNLNISFVDYSEK